MNNYPQVWNLKDLLPEHAGEQFDKIVSELKGKVSLFEKKRGLLAGNIPSSEFNLMLDELGGIKEILKSIEAYAYLWFSEDTSSQDARAFLSKAEMLSTEAENKVLFLLNWFKGLDEANAQRLINDSGKNRYFLEHVRKLKEHALSEEVEQAVNLKSVAGIDTVVKLYNIIKSSFRFQLDGKELTESELAVFVRDPNPEIRKQAYEALLKVYSSHSDVLGEIYSSVVRDWFNEHLTLRGYPSAIVVRNKANDIPDEAVDVMLEACRKNAHLFSRYFEIKAKALGIKMSRYHIYAPLKGEVQKIKYEEAVKLVLNTFSSYSPRISALAEKIFETKHIHAQLGKNKKSGAYCYSITPKDTPYVLVNYTETMRDVETIAHELGHAVHSMLASDKTIFTFHSALPLAETASVFGEMIVTQRLFEQAKDISTKKSLLASKIDDFYATIIRQAFFVLFEKEAHKLFQSGATIKQVADCYYKNLKEQFNNIEIPEIFLWEWLIIPHLYHTPFYCYAYSFGNLLTLALYKMYKEEGKDFIPKYIKLLSYGGSESPQKMLSELGIDITDQKFWQKGFDVVKEMVDEFERI